MVFLIVLACVVPASFLLKPAIKKAPGAWYALAALLVLLYLAGVQGVLPTWARGIVFLLMQKGALAAALFVVVMFIGVFPRDSKTRLYMAPIRAELSIFAGILICGHMLAYSVSYVPRLVASTITDPYVLAGLVVAALLVGLVAVLDVTSLSHVKTHMSTRTWKKVQKGAYVFYGLIYIHVLAMLLPSAMNGGSAAVQSIAVYTAVFVVYAVARVTRAVMYKKRKQAAVPVG